MHCLRTRRLLAAFGIVVAAQSAAAQSWSADNGNGTYSNPLFYDEFSDPDLIRVGKDFYLTGTTMHAMPGLPILHSRDLVNWTFLAYAFDRLDLGPAFRLEDGKQIYGQGIWAPSFRYHNGTFYIFTNINGQHTQRFTATNPRGPWTRTEMKGSFHDLSVLFDDDGRAYVIWGYQDLHFAELDSTRTDTIPGTGRVLFAKTAGMGEGSHFYKIRGKYYITSAWYAGRMRMPAARADKPEGPYEVNQAISIDEDFGLVKGRRLRNNNGTAFDISAPDTNSRGGISMHQGGIVDTPGGEWWGFSMIDYNSVGRLTALSPVTWKDGWPYFGLEGNLGRTPRMWVKPSVEVREAPRAPYERSDDFSGRTLKPVWQWNHAPDDTRWSLTERRGFLRLHALPARDVWWARNTLTQRAIGPRSSPVAVLETTAMAPGDVAGLALLNAPYSWIGVRRDSSGFRVVQYDQATGKTEAAPLTATRVWLRADCDFLSEVAHFSYSTDGVHFRNLGADVLTVFQLRTFQGVRYALFNFNEFGATGGFADFDALTVNEPAPRGITRAIPNGRVVQFSTGDTSFRARVIQGHSERSRGIRTSAPGRVSLEQDGRFLSVDSAGAVASRQMKPTQLGDAETFQWVETIYGDVMLMSLVNHRYLTVDHGTLHARTTGPTPGRKDGAQFRWSVEKR